MEKHSNLNWKKGEVYPAWSVFIALGIAIAAAVIIWVLKLHGYI